MIAHSIVGAVLVIHKGVIAQHVINFEVVINIAHMSRWLVQVLDVNEVMEA